MSKKNILILVNKYTTIINFRLEVVEALVKAGYNVFVSVPYHERNKEIEAVGATVIDTPFEKNGTNPAADFSLMLTYRKLIRKVKADLVLTYTIKPNTYGGMAAALTGTPYIANITGLGTALENGGKMQKLAIMLYRLGFSKVSTVFFQNADNQKFFEDRGIALGKHELIPGSGVNLDRFRVLSYPEKETVEFAFISRIMKEKGIEQYIEAAKVIKAKYPNTVFHVGGFGDEYYENRMKQLHEEGLISYHGLLTDVRELLKDVHCVVHPTYYPEGMSNVLLESAASARPIISTDRAGCREAIEDGRNGFIVEQKNTEDLIEKLEAFLNLSFEEKKNMGLNGRMKMESEFDRNIIVRRYLEKAEKYVMCD